MLVSIVTVLSRLPSLAATMEAKFSAPAESKATVKEKKKKKNRKKPPVFIPSVHYLLLSRPPLPDSICFVPADVMWSEPQRCGYRQCVSALVSPSFSLALFFFSPHNVFNISFLWKPGFSFFYVSALPSFFLPPEINRMNVNFFLFACLNQRCLGLCLIYYEQAALLHTSATSCLMLVL